MRPDVYDELCALLTDFEQNGSSEEMSDGEWLDLFYEMCVKIQNNVDY